MAPSSSARQWNGDFPSVGRGWRARRDRDAQSIESRRARALAVVPPRRQPLSLHRAARGWRRGAAARAARRQYAAGDARELERAVGRARHRRVRPRRRVDGTAGESGRGATRWRAVLDCRQIGISSPRRAPCSASLERAPSPSTPVATSASWSGPTGMATRLGVSGIPRTTSSSLDDFLVTRRGCGSRRQPGLR